MRSWPASPKNKLTSFAFDFSTFPAILIPDKKIQKENSYTFNIHCTAGSFRDFSAAGSFNERSPNKKDMDSGVFPTTTCLQETITQPPHIHCVCDWMVASIEITALFRVNFVRARPDNSYRQRVVKVNFWISPTRHHAVTSGSACSVWLCPVVWVRKSTFAVWLFWKLTASGWGWEGLNKHGRRGLNLFPDFVHDFRVFTSRESGLTRASE